MVTGGSHNSSDFTFSNVSASAPGSPGEQASQSSSGPLGFGFGFGTYVTVTRSMKKKMLIAKKLPV
jgi:hypothetical protein